MRAVLNAPRRKSQDKTATRSSGGTLYSIQYLRALAAYLVVAYHITSILSGRGGTDGVFAAGAAGVDIFFVLSGFLMAMIVSNEGDVDGRFLLRRMIRIAPLYYLLTAVLFLLAAVAPGLLHSHRLDFGRLIASFLFVPYPSGDGEVTPILSLGWTLNYEMFFYCLIALTTQFFRDKKLLVTSMMLVGFVVAGRLYDFGLLWRFYTDPIILEFMAGILIYHYVFPEGENLHPALPALLFSSGTAAIILGGPADVHRAFSMGLPSVLLVTGGILVLNFRAEWLKKLGDWSYSTYLVHTFVIHLALIPLAAYGLANPVALAAVAIPVIIVMSGLMYNLFEIPMVRELRWLCSVYYKPGEVKAAALRR